MSLEDINYIEGVQLFLRCEPLPLVEYFREFTGDRATWKYWGISFYETWEAEFQTDESNHYFSELGINFTLQTERNVPVYWTDGFGID